jgi:hypothetical protein
MHYALQPILIFFHNQDVLDDIAIVNRSVMIDHSVEYSANADESFLNNSRQRHDDIIISHEGEKALLNRVIIFLTHTHK